MYQTYAAPASLTEALDLKRRLGDQARVCAGGTDLLLELERAGPHVRDCTQTLLDLTQIPGLAAVQQHADGRFELGPLVTHNQCIADPRLVQRAFPLIRACWEVGAPPLRNRATVVGNVVTASPANDTLVPLSLLDTTVRMTSAARGTRSLPLADFITGFRTTALAPDELVTGLSFAGLPPRTHGIFLKLGLRSAQAISVVSVAVIVQHAHDRRTSPVTDLRIALGAVAPVIVRATEAEEFALGRTLDEETITTCSRLAAHAADPIDDVRGSAEYRTAMVTTLVQRALQALATARERTGWSENPVMLWGPTEGKWPATSGQDRDRATAQVNGALAQLPGNCTLLDSLREAGWHEVKKGCAEGECGSCTVFLDGMAVLSCLVPAERARGSQVVTASGLTGNPRFERLQQAFVDCGSVQCGYCIPGFVMSGAKLLEEVPVPDRAQAREAFMGNLCRCTGYAKILDAVVSAGQDG